MRRSTGIMEKTLKESGSRLCLGRVENVHHYLELVKPRSLKELKKSLSRLCGENRGFLSLIIYRTTGDDNFFRVVEEVPVQRSISFRLDQRKKIRENKEKNYLRRARLSAVVDPEIYSRENIYWHSIYSSYKSKKRTYIIQYLVSASDTYHLMTGYSRSINFLRKAMAVVSFILVLAVSFLTMVFLNNYSLLISNLTRSISRAARGEYDISINQTDDEQLNELASSFNSLVDELKEMSAKEPLGELFGKGVELLKENRLENAVSIFSAIVLMKPEGHGSYFNLGVAYARLKKYRLSMEMFEKAREIKPDYELTHKYMDRVEKMIALNAGQN
jgi:tetratricopeptide (TPR) repeat protein